MVRKSMVWDYPGPFSIGGTHGIFKRINQQRGRRVLKRYGPLTRMMTFKRIGFQRNL